MSDSASTDSQSAQSNKQLTEDQLLTIYSELCSNIRATDEISFKLLGAVPFASGVGAGALTILEKSKLLSSYTAYAVVFLSLLGAVITLGLFRWELRNIQKCNWLIACAARVEEQLLPHDKYGLQYKGIAKEQQSSVTRVEHVQLSPIFVKVQKPDPAQETSTTQQIKASWTISRSWGKTEAEKLIYTAAFVAWLIPLAVALISLVSTVGDG